MFPSERLLLAGAAGQIRNQLASYRSEADGPEAHYPSIDSARDNSGRDGHKSPQLLFVPLSTLSGLPRINVGDTITFELEATDPRGRELWRRVTLLPGDAKPLTFGDYAPLADASGNRATITWTVGEDDVGEYRQVVIALANAGRYHRPRRMGRWRAVPLPRQPAS